MKVLRHGTGWLRIAVLAFAILVALVAANAAAAGTVRRVPQDFPTIQAAIDAAVDGDTVLVSPGTYVERIDFRLKEITVESVAGPDATVIDGSGVGVVVKIAADPGETPILRGFTIRNGGDDNHTDGGVDTSGGPALIEKNRVVGNAFCDGGGVEAAFSAATIRDNVISDNAQTFCIFGTGGGGISLLGAGTVKVVNNVISANSHTIRGGGIGLFGAGTPTIVGNVISGNSAASEGGGIAMLNFSDALITNNLIFGNRAVEGGGVWWRVPFGSASPRMVNNTVAGNEATLGLAVFVDGFDAASRVANNVLAGSGSGAVLECGVLFDPKPPAIEFNDVFNAGSGPSYGGVCTDQTGLNGNISADPLFVDAAAGNFHLQAASPAVDAGLDADAPPTDIDGDPRPLDGNGDGAAVVDIGADEVLPDATPPTITCRATPSVLWPPNHKLRPVSVDVSARDESSSVTVTLVSVASSQRDRARGSGDVPNDVQGWDTGTDDRSGFLRAERFKEARVYTLTYQAVDSAGNTASCQTTVTVPKSQGEGPESSERSRHRPRG